ncbi:MAG TPA: DJ-1/PfpI family protein [Candidatus Omnitrophota bacterium]|nr:DJ-1/PfpI family protein [Candidatus Omnitrophota bacterium]
MAKTAIVILAEGFEEVEALAPVDVLRRAGVRVMIAGLTDKIVTSSRGIKVQTDILFKDSQELPDALILHGGVPGAENLSQSPDLADFIKKMNKAGKIVAAICAAPAVVLAPTGILDGKTATCYPGCESNFSKATVHSKDRVVADGPIITSQGPGTALEFSLEIVRQLVSEDMARNLREKMLIKA